MWGAVTEAGAAVGSIGAVLVGAAVFLVVLGFVFLCVISPWLKPSQRQHVLAVLDRMTALITVVRGGRRSRK